VEGVKGEEGFRVEEIGKGRFRVTFESPYKFGDRVSYNSKVNGSGKGKILDLVVQNDGKVHYTIELSDGKAQSGIYPDEIKLIGTE
jgi:hypothetical protein